jgi:hypothetical protein
MDEVIAIIKVLQEEYDKYKKLLAKTKKQSLNNPLNQELLNQLEQYEHQITELKAFIMLVSEASETLLEITEVDNTQLDQQYQLVNSKIDIFTQKYTDIINTTFDINRDALNIAEKVVEGLDLSREVVEYEGIKGYVASKIASKAINLCDVYIPYWDEIQKVLAAITPEVSEIPKAKLDESTAVDMKKVLLKGKAKELDSVNKLKKLLDNSYHEIKKSQQTNVDKYIKLRTLYNILDTSIDKMVPSDSFFSSQVDKMLYVCLQELFEKCNTTVVQVCHYTSNALDGYELDKSALIQTKFSNDDGINQHIFDILSNMNVAVKNGKIESSVLNSVFPNTKIVYEGLQEDNPLSFDKDEDANPTALDKLDFDENHSIGEQYAGHLINKREKEALARQQAKELPELQKRAAKFGIDINLDFAELKQKVEAAEAAAAEEFERKYKEEQARIAKEKRENQERIKENTVEDKPYGENTDMQFEFGKTYDIGATFGVRESDQKGNLDTGSGYKRIEEFAESIQKLGPTKVIYYAYLDNSATGKYHPIAVETGLSQFHGSLRSATGLELSKEIGSIELYDTKTKKKGKRLGRFLEFK